MGIHGFPEYPQVPNEERARQQREHEEHEQRRAAELREWKRKYKAAMKAGDMEALKKLGPMYP